LLPCLVNFKFAYSLFMNLGRAALGKDTIVDPSKRFQSHAIFNSTMLINRLNNDDSFGYARSTYGTWRELRCWMRNARKTEDNMQEFSN
jgi:hypothetical protein